MWIIYCQVCIHVLLLGIFNTNTQNINFETHLGKLGEAGGMGTTRRRRWVMRAPRAPPKRQLRAIQKAISRRKNEERARLVQLQLALEKQQAASSSSSSEGAPVTVTTGDAGRGDGMVAAPASASSTTSSSASDAPAPMDEAPTQEATQPHDRAVAASGEGDGTGGAAQNAADGEATHEQASGHGNSSKPLTEEERQAKINELEKRLEQMGEQKHKLFLLLKQVLFVDEKKRKRLAEEERIRLEEQRRWPGLTNPLVAASYSTTMFVL